MLCRIALNFSYGENTHERWEKVVNFVLVELHEDSVCFAVDERLQVGHVDFASDSQRVEADPARRWTRYWSDSIMAETLGHHNNCLIQ